MYIEENLRIDESFLSSSDEKNSRLKEGGTQCYQVRKRAAEPGSPDSLRLHVHVRYW